MISDQEHGHPLGVDPSLHQGTQPTPEEAIHLIDEFWRSDPTEIWQPYVQATDEVLASNKSVVLFSAMHGSGKSMQLFATLRNGRSEGTVRIIDQLPFKRSLGPEVFAGDRAFSKPQLVLVDEDTAQSQEEAQVLAKSISNGVEAAKQFVVAIPGPNQQARSNIVHLSTKALEEHAIEPVYLGDVTDVHIPVQRATELLKTLGFQEEVVSLFEGLEALRSPRLFANLVDTLVYYDAHRKQAEVKKQDVKEILRALIDPYNTPKGAALNRAISIAANLTSSQNRSNTPFTSTCLTTADCIGLYKALDVDLPQESDFGSPEWYTYAYNKD